MERTAGILIVASKKRRGEKGVDPSGIRSIFNSDGGEAGKEEVGMQKEENDLRERTKMFALTVVRMFGALPKTTEAQVLGKQVLRSGTSVGANYHEAYRARSKAEFIAKCGDSLRELEETGYWLELLVTGEIVPSDKLSSLRQECNELTAIFVTILKRSKEPQRTS